MKFLVDQPVSRLVAEALRAAGHDAVHVADVDLWSAPDSAILEHARIQDRVIVTQDTDFGTLLASSRAANPSVVLFRMSDGRPQAQIRVLLSNLSRIERDLADGAITVFCDGSIRIRRLPIR